MALSTSVRKLSRWASTTAVKISHNVGRGSTDARPRLQELRERLDNGDKPTLNTKGQEKVSGKALFDEVYEKGSLIPYQIILESMQQSNIRTMDRVNGGSDGGLNEREQVDGRNSTIKEGSPKLFMDNYGRNHNYVR